MKTFLDHVAEKIKADHGNDIGELAIVLPTRRGALFLRESLAETFQQTLWSPSMLSIQDFVRSLTPYQFPEQLSLNFELYRVYKKHMEARHPGYSESFERFYAWGEMLLKDFDEIDKYLVDSNGLFTNIRDLRRIEMEFGMSEVDAEALLRFWQSVHGLNTTEDEEAISPVKKTFLDIWEVLGDVYTDFRKQLHAKGMAYDGMAYREVVEALGEESLELPYKQVIFAGFNALSFAEQEMIRLLMDQQKAQIIWDVDSCYYPEKTFKGKVNWQFGAISEEAGKFIRKLHPDWEAKGSSLVINQMVKEEKEVTMTGVPLQTAQARLLGQLLSDLPADPEELRKHAIVLADENLLFPVLYALPESIELLNITMGFPLRQSHVYHLLHSITGLIRNQLPEHQGMPHFAHADVLQVLNSPYVKALAPILSEKLQREIQKKNLMFVPLGFLDQAQAPALFRHIFAPPANTAEAIPYFDELFDLLLEDAQKREAHLETEYIFQFFTLFNRFKDILNDFGEPLTLRGFSDILREAIRKGRIPFEGEPLIGLQLMGILESRTLDFEHVYILGANEGSLPDTSSGNSFIPYHLRKGFRMPTYEEKDAIFAYHFFRLLQRARHVHLIYNSNTVDGKSSQEMSRYLQQLRLYQQLFPKMNLVEKQYQIPAPFDKQPEISINKGNTITDKIREKYLGTNKKFLSATALSTFLACPIKFYFKYIAEIKEPESLEESMEAGTFGTVLHSTMEYLYQDFIHKEVHEDDIKEMRARLDQAMKQAFQEQNIPWDLQLQGKNYLYREVIRKLCLDILEQDMVTAPFVIKYLEDNKSFHTQLKIGEETVNFNGLFDRVDQMADSAQIRIVDYKTGKVEFGSNAYAALDVFDEEKWDRAQWQGIKEAFQGYLYAWLYNKKFPDAAITMGYYTARKLQKGLVYLNEGEPIPSSELQLFEEELTKLIRRIFKSDFPQTEQEARCGFCAYREICGRA